MVKEAKNGTHRKFVHVCMCVFSCICYIVSAGPHNFNGAVSGHDLVSQVGLGLVWGYGSD